MKKLSMIIAILLIGIPMSLYGQNLYGTSSTYGNTTYHNIGGTTGTSSTYGNTTYHNIGR
jgi:hypothetical protein